MDISKQYIEMCKEAKEIQALWKPTGGDWLVFDYRGTTKAGKEFEKKIWGDDDKTWQRVEILCYQPPNLKNWWISTTGEKSVVKSAQDITREHCIWLPRQDQLQAMINKYDLSNEIVEFYCFVSGRIPKTNEIIHEPIWDKFTSMEQLWLAFVMREVCNKVWRGNSWR